MAVTGYGDDEDADLTGCGKQEKDAYVRGQVKCRLIAYCGIRLTNGASGCEGARGSRRATSDSTKARRLPAVERALDSCMRWLGAP